MLKKYIVNLTDRERDYLEQIINKGKTQAYKIKHANILLSVDANVPGLSDKETAKTFRCHLNTVYNIRQRFVEEGMEAALQRKRQKEPSRKRLLDGEKEAKLIAIACSTPRKGYAKWTLNMLADELVALNIVDSISDQTVRRTLKKTNYVPTCVNAG